MEKCTGRVPPWLSSADRGGCHGAGPPDLPGDEGSWRGGTRCQCLTLETDAEQMIMEGEESELFEPMAGTLGMKPRHRC